MASSATLALVVGALAAAPSGASAITSPDPGPTLAPGVTVVADHGHSVVAQKRVTMRTENGATVARVDGKVVAALSASQTKEVNALAAGIDAANRSFDADAAAQAGASAQGIAELSAVLAAGGWATTGQAAVSARSAAAAAFGCAGYNGYHGYYFPWGAQYGFNSCNTATLIADVGLGAAGGGVILGALALGGVATGGASTLVAAVLALGVAGLVACQAHSSNGAIWLNVGGFVGVLGMSCWGQ